MWTRQACVFRRAICAQISDAPCVLVLRANRGGGLQTTSHPDAPRLGLDLECGPPEVHRGVVLDRRRHQGHRRRVAEGAAWRIVPLELGVTWSGLGDANVLRCLGQGAWLRETRLLQPRDPSRRRHEVPEGALHNPEEGLLDARGRRHCPTPAPPHGMGHRR